MKYPYFKTVIYDDFYEMLDGLYKNHANKIAVKFWKNDKIIKVTYRNLVRHVCALFNYLEKQEICNKHIAVISENRFEYIPIYLSSVFSNVIVPLDKELDEESLLKCIKKFDINVVFFTNKTKESILQITKNKEIKLINIDEEYDKIVAQELPKEDDDIDNFFDEISNVDKDKFCVLVSTSGTDGEMKGVMLSQYNVVINLRGSLENNILKSPSLSILPMNHTYGFNPGVLATLYNGTTLCINDSLKHLVRDFKKFNPYFFGAVPMVVEGIYNNILREARRTKKDKLLSKMIKVSNTLLKYKIDIRHLLFGNIINKRLRLIVSGGAMLNPYYVERFEELGIKVLNGYGLTECAPIIAVNREINNVVGSVGTIVNHEEVKIADDGEILVKGPNIMLGYYKDDELTKEAFVDGYFKTGDLGYVEDDVIYITGRKKNLIILSNGKNVSPETIEQKLLNISYIKECVVTTRMVKNNQIIVAKLYMEEQSDKLDEDIKKVNSELPNYMQIDEYEILAEEFKKNSTKKIRRNMYVG